MRKIWEALNYPTKLRESLYITKNILSKEVGAKNIGNLIMRLNQNILTKEEGAKAGKGLLRDCIRCCYTLKHFFFFVFTF